MKKIFKYLGLPVFLLGISIIILLSMAGRYLYQEKAQLVYMRATQAEVAWQSGKFPSLKFVFDILRFPYSVDPAKTFETLTSSDITAKILIKPPLQVGPSPDRLTKAPQSSFFTTTVSSSSELFAAIKKASADDVIVVTAGEYVIKAHNIPLLRSGYKDHPITLRAEKLGDVTLYLNTLEGFYVAGAYWKIENFIINGACKNDAGCEHAFHVVGNGHHVILENNIVKNFNSHVKIGNVKGKSPDFGVIEHNIFYNDAPRKTDTSVTLIDVVNVSDWRVSNNIIADFAKLYSDNTSYAAFFKGGSKGNIFEKNLIMCEWQHKGGIRVGLSFGGGGTAAQYCPNKDCSTEQFGGIIRNNIIMNCPRDVGIYLNKSADTLIHNNILYNTHGIDARYETTTARIFNNVIDGRIRNRNGGTHQAQNNVMSIMKAIKLDSITEEIYQNPALGNFEPRHSEDLKMQGVSARNLGEDFCGHEHPERQSDIGPVNLQSGEKCSMNLDFINYYIR
ncbi:MAG: hypothetical protein K9G26_05235 [Emcibacter sp.]|nr:hypothetical protein [Emcibacter sp.]